MDGVDAIISIRSEFPKARIIVLTTYAGDVLAQRALKAGAQAYLLKNDVRKDLMDTIRAVHSGRSAFIRRLPASSRTTLGTTPSRGGK